MTKDQRKLVKRAQRARDAARQTGDFTWSNKIHRVLWLIYHGDVGVQTFRVLESLAIKAEEQVVELSR